MQQRAHLSFVSVLFVALLPLTVWGYGFYDYPGERGYHPYAESAGGNHYLGSLQLQTAMTEDGYYVRAYLEGLRPEDLQIYLRRNRLVLQIAQGDRYGLYNPYARRASQWQVRFRRQLRLPYDADWARMTTSTRNGLMEIYIPRRNQ
jgi:HSP20 family molecular chaperone IbpA